MATHELQGLAVEVDGEGSALLCLHGLGGSSNVWTPVLPALQGFRLIRPDLPGSGRSALPAGRLSIDGYVDAMVRLLDALQVQSVHVAAHSMGTIVAQHLALALPGRVQSLVLFGPLLAPPEAAKAPTLARAALARTGMAALQQIADAIVQGATARETRAEQPAALALIRELLMRQAPEGYAQSCEALAGAVPAAIEQIRVPTLLVTGDQDGVAPPANVAAMAARIAGSTHVVLDGCGHWTPVERPAPCTAQLQRFHAALR